MKPTFSQETIDELAAAAFPTHKNAKLAQSAVEFVLSELYKNGSTDPSFDTLRRFVDFLITIKGYN